MSDANPAPTREELKQKLRQKINEKRSSSPSDLQRARQARSDPQTAMLSMGIDNALLLEQSKTIAKNPTKALKDVRALLASHPADHFS
jgi:uncharacterized membrane protein